MMPQEVAGRQGMQGRTARPFHPDERAWRKTVRMDEELQTDFGGTPAGLVDRMHKHPVSPTANDQSRVG